MVQYAANTASGLNHQSCTLATNRFGCFPHLSLAKNAPCALYSPAPGCERICMRCVYTAVYAFIYMAMAQALDINGNCLS